jgi:hypothetical protein
MEVRLAERLAEIQQAFRDSTDRAVKRARVALARAGIQAEITVEHTKHGSRVSYPSEYAVTVRSALNSEHGRTSW